MIDTETENNIRREQLRLVYKPVRWSQAASLLNALAILLINWNEIPRTDLLIWFMLLSIISAFRVLDRHRFLNIEETRFSIKHWERRFLTGVILSAATWGSASWFLYSETSLEHQMFLIFIFAGLTAGGLTSLAGNYRAVSYFTLLILLPLAARLFLTATFTGFLMGTMIVLYMAMLLSGGKRFNQTIRESLFLRFQSAQREQLLLAAKQDAEYASRAKSQFLANMSHEIRTPLTAVLGLAKMGIRENQGRASQERFVHILNSGRHLLNVINDILDFSKVEAGMLATESHAFQLIPAVEEAIGVVSEQASKKHLTLSLNFDSALPKWVQGDAMRIHQILLNLLSNAIKFTSQGKVSLSVTQQHGMIHFVVNDTGIGMNTEVISRLFAPFEQADSSTTRKYGGTGLGLAICRDLAKLMGGDILVQSKPGIGSEFTLSLPLPSVTPEIELGDSISDTGPQLQGKRILAAEDVELNRIILEDLLIQEGASLEFAENGKQALDKLEERGRYHFDLVLMDVQMPVMDGLEATRLIRKLVPELPVIGLTAHALQEEREKCLASGMVDHLTKPIDADLLIEKIKSYINMSRP